ncbi:hypothetical protein L596_005124 [Steinernema carpocapsae]|uniref:Uncharacterized protein n=1 Tax=Steinernema carpocapsae TaxID=34508 RepID=A0A4U8V1L4_STECR|nr:hypothetical protein L596_005124 [Steinernema carpocapsae]
MCSRPLVEDEVNQKAIEESTEKLTLLKSSKRPAADAEEEIGKKKSRFPKKLSAFGDLSIGSKMAKVAARIVTVSCYRTAGRKPVTKVLLQDRDGDCCTLLGWEDEADRLHKALDGKEFKVYLDQKVVVTHLKVGRAEVQYARGSAHRIELKASPLSEIYLDAETTVEIPKVSLRDIPKFLHKKISFEAYAAQQVSKMGPHFCTIFTDKKFAVEFRSKKEFEADLFDYVKVSHGFVKHIDEAFVIELADEGLLEVEHFIGGPEPFDEFDLKSLKR